MSTLTERLEEFAKRGGRRCALCEFLENLPTNEARSEWDEALANPRYSHEQFVRLLQAEGVEEIGRASVGNHRRNSCRR